MIGYKGKSYNVNEETIGRILSIKKDTFGTSYLLSTSLSGDSEETYGLIRCGNPVPGLYSSQSFFSKDRIDLEINDIVKITNDGKLLIIFNSSSEDNCLFVTSDCNSSCLMCPQPPKEDNGALYWEAIKIIELLEEGPKVIGITGGEPLLDYNSFRYLLNLIKSKFPDTQIQLLTNGRILRSAKKVLEILDIAGDGITFCIPLYSDYSVMHDKLVGIKGAFVDTMEGLHHLGKLKARIELRTVVLKPNQKRLSKFATFVCKNLPYVEHVAVMGMEPIGFAAKNFSDCWADPAEYQNELCDAVFRLDSFGIPVYIFNHQLCTIPETLWPFAVKSISKWKIRFIDECNNCLVREKCGGLFFASSKKHSRIINAIT